MDGKGQTDRRLHTIPWYKTLNITGLEYIIVIIHISVIIFEYYYNNYQLELTWVPPSVMEVHLVDLVFISPSVSSLVRCNLPSLGKTMRYSALHCGQATRAVLLPRCFSSTQRCRQAWWTHLVEPRQWHGRTHSAVRSSSSVAKHTQQLLKANTRTRRLDDGNVHMYTSKWKQ